MIEDKLEEIVVGLVAVASAVGVVFKTRGGSGKADKRTSQEARLLKIEEHMGDLSERTAGIEGVLKTIRETQQIIVNKLIG